MVLRRPQWCCKSLLWRDTGQVSDSRPHPERPISDPTQMQAESVPLTQCIHIHSDTKARLYIHVHPERPPPTCCQTPGCTWSAYRHLERPPPISTPIHAHSHSALNAPSYKEQHGNTHTPAYPETRTHSYSHMCTQSNHPQSTHLHTCFHTHVLIHRHTCSATATRTGVCRVACKTTIHPDAHTQAHYLQQASGLYVVPLRNILHSWFTQGAFLHRWPRGPLRL